MSQYEGWTNIETFMVSSLIDNDRSFLKYTMDAIERYTVNSMEAQLPGKLALMVTDAYSSPKHNNEAEAKDFILVRIRLKKELTNLILQAFFDQVNWDELTEHYKTKYVENLVNDKDILEQIEKDKQSSRTSSNEPNIANTVKPGSWAEFTSLESSNDDDSFPLPDYYGE